MNRISERICSTQNIQSLFGVSMDRFSSELTTVIVHTTHNTTVTSAEMRTQRCAFASTPASAYVDAIVTARERADRPG